MKIFITIFVFAVPIYLSAQKDNNFIDWSGNKRLVWEDFTAEPVKGSDAAALTATHLGFSYSFSKNKVAYKIECRFDKTKSWGLVQSDWILKHEQGHFDIAEIFARKLHKIVSAYQFNRKTFQKDLDSIYQSIVTEKEVFQLQYDNETNFSRNKLRQEEWLKKIAMLLKEYESFSAYNS